MNDHAWALTHLSGVAFTVLGVFDLVAPFVGHLLHLFRMGVIPFVEFGQQLFDLAFLGIESRLDVFEFECERCGTVAVGVEFLQRVAVSDSPNSVCAET